VEYWQATLKTDNTLVMQEQVASSTGWVNDTDNNSDLELDNGSWVAEKFDNGNVTFEILNDNRILLKIDSVNYEKLKTFESDISGETIYDAELDRYIAMPQGAKRVLMSIERMQDTYRIWQPMYSYDNCDQNGCDKNTILNFAALIDKMCAGERGWFSGNYEGGYGFAGTSQQPSAENDWRNYSCDNQATSGTLFEIKNNYYSGSEIISQNAGTWEIKSVGGVNILIVKPKNPYKYNDANDGLEYKIFTIYENKVWEGGFEPQGEGDSWYAYNDVAINTIKPIALKVHQDSLNNSGNSGDDDSSGGDNSGGGDNGGGQTLTINPPTTYAMSNTDGQQSVVLTTLSTLAFKIVNYTNNTIGNLGISFGDATQIGNYATRTSLVINPGNNHGSVDVGLQARNSDGVESNIATITITVNDGGNNGGGGNSTPTNFVELISQRCGTNGDFDKHETNNDLYLAFECPTDSSATSGNLVSVDRSDWDNPNITGNAGTWAITQVHGVNILQTNPTNPNDWDDDGDKTIFAMKDGYIWRGEIEAQPTGEVFSAYNLTAADSIKNAIISVTSDGSTTEFSDISSATAVTSITAFIGTGKKLYFDFEYCNCTTPTVKLDATLLKDGAMTDTPEKVINGVWTAYQENTEYRLDSGSWVDDSSSAYTITGNSTISIGSYGEFEVYTQSVAGDTITVLGESITLPADSVRFYLKRISNDTPDVYYLWSKE
jgi:uncharacterized membrane protein YgcG